MFKRPQADILALIIATVTEYAGLFYWVQAVDEGQVALGILIVVVGLLAERIAVYIGIRAVYGPHPPHPRITFNLIISGLLETVAWLIWLFIADSINAVLAAVILGLMILVLHSYQLGYFRRGKPFAYLADPTTIVFSAMEGIFAYYWLFYVRADVGLFTFGPVQTGAIILFVGLLIEHIVQGSMLGKEDRPDRMLPA